MAATVYQRPLSQGRLALQALYQFLLNGTQPPPRLRAVPYLVMRSNLDLMLERLPIDLETADPSAGVIAAATARAGDPSVARSRGHTAIALRSARRGPGHAPDESGWPVSDVLLRLTLHVGQGFSPAGMAR